MDQENVVYIYAMEYYSAIKKNEIMLFTGGRMELQIIMLSKVGQIQKDKGLHVFSHMWKLEDKHIHKYKHGYLYLYLNPYLSHICNSGTI
jgi:hypothetical protein